MSMAVPAGSWSSRPLTTVARMGKFLECSSTSCARLSITTSDSEEVEEVVEEGCWGAVFLGSTHDSRQNPERSLRGWLERTGDAVGTTESAC